MSQHSSMNHTSGGHVESRSPEHGDGHGGHQAYHAHMVADFRRRFWISLALTIPVLALAEMIRRAIGLEDALAFSGDSLLEFFFASAIFFYGGWPFLNGLVVLSPAAGAMLMSLSTVIVAINARLLTLPADHDAS